MIPRRRKSPVAAKPAADRSHSTCAATNLSKHPPAAVMHMNCPADALISTSRVYRFTSPRYPVRVRVYDENGAFLKESREYLPWSFLTNGLHRGAAFSYRWHPRDACCPPAQA